MRIRTLVTAIAVAAALLATGCSTAAIAPRPAATRDPLPPDPHTASALLAIATTFNRDYDTGDYAPAQYMQAVGCAH